MDTNENEEYYLTEYQLITTDDEESDEIEDSIDPAKPSTSAAAQIDTAIPSPILQYL